MFFRIIATIVFLINVSTLAKAVSPNGQSQHEILLITGAPGEESYVSGFEKAAQHWIEIAEKAEASISHIGSNSTDSRPLIKDWLESIEHTGDKMVWIIYIGHGTHNNRQTFLNLKGPDLDHLTLSKWIEPIKRPLIFIHGGSASAPFIPELSGENRIIITATQSVDEINYARFGERFAFLLNSGKGDLDQDGQTSLLEAFVSTYQDIKLIYKESGRLVSEHALIDDNGDTVGTPAEWFNGTRMEKRPNTDHVADGFRSHQIALISSKDEKLLSSEQKSLRDQLETKIENLRKRKSELGEDAYYEALEELLLDLSKIYLSPEIRDQPSASETQPIVDS